MAKLGKAKGDNSETMISFPANSYILGIDGELYKQAEIVESIVDGKKKLQQEMVPQKLGQILAGYVGTGDGIPVEKKYRCFMLAHKLDKHSKKKGKAGRFLITVDDITILKDVVTNMKFGDQKQTTDLHWLRANLLYCIDPSVLAEQGNDVKEYLEEMYSDYDAKVREYENSLKGEKSNSSDGASPNTGMN